MIATQRRLARFRLPGLHFVGTEQLQSQRRIRQGIAATVADQRHQLHRLAGPVDAALGIKERIHGSRRGAALDAPVAEIEGRFGQIEKVVIAVAIGHQQRRLAPAATAQQARIEADIALVVGGRLAQFAVVAGIQPQIKASQRLGGGQRAGEYVQPVIAAQREQADVGDDQPLRGPVLVAVRVFLERLGSHDVDARLRITQNFVDRNRGDHILIAFAADQVQGSLPQQFTGIFGDPADVVTIERVSKAPIQNLLQQIAVIDAQHPHPRLIHIDADQRQLLAAGFGQHVGGPAKTQGWFAVLDLGSEVLRSARLFARRRRDAGARLDRVALAMADAFDAQLPALGADHRLERRLDHQIILIVNLPALGEVIGKLETDFRGGAVRFNLDALDLEGVGVGQLLITLGDPGVVLQLQPFAEGGEGLFRFLGAVVQFAQPEQGAGALERDTRRLVGIPGGLPGSLLGAVAGFFVLLLLGLGLPELTQIQPCSHRVSAGDDGGFLTGDGGSPVLARRLLAGLLQQGVRRLTGASSAIADQLQILSRRHGERRILNGVGARRQQ